MSHKERQEVKGRRRILCSSGQGQQQLETEVETIHPWKHTKEYRNQQRLAEKEEQQTPARASSRPKSEPNHFVILSKLH